MNDSIIILSHLFIVIIAFFSIAYTFGVVWRVEKKLDISFKLLLVAIIAFTVSEIIPIFTLEGNDLAQATVVTAKIIFIVFFLAGILEMRSMLRKMDGEIK
ncbi:MAG: hypothetical protein Q7T51_01715 [Candidatus Moranbacteria bacterium]|nr:hypothetical protein [Candidatus Moranbacteria bacterium]